MTTNLPTPEPLTLESIYALGLIIQALKFTHEEYAAEIKGSSSYPAPLLTYVQKLSIIMQNDVIRLHRLIEKHKGDQPEENMVAPYYEACDLIKDMIETTLVLANVKDARTGIRLAREMLAHVRKQVADGPKVRKSRSRKVVSA